MRTTRLIALLSMLAAATPLAGLPAPLAQLEFTVGTAELTDRAEQLLDKTVDLLLRDPVATAVIIAPLNGSEDDADLCLRRADVARTYLAKRGVAWYRIVVAGGATPAGADSSQTGKIQLVIASDNPPVQPSAERTESHLPVSRIAF